MWLRLPVTVTTSGVPYIPSLTQQMWTPISQKSQTSECTLTRISTSSETWLEAERFECFVLSPYSKGLSDGEGLQRHYYAKLQQL